MNDESSESPWMALDEQEHLKGMLHVALSSSLVELNSDNVTPVLTMRGAVTLMPED